ncbi:MAG: winged helix-turn-helix transcriptional regulator [Opitutaceae bacterium]|nr:winged helix-turn-helix transcriptional regulator [Opitutaceae bacterium]
MTLSREERLHGVAALILRSARRYWTAVDAGELPLPPEFVETSDMVPGEPMDDSRRILDYLNRRGAAAPKDIRLALGLSRATAQRRLAQLAREGQIVPQGQTQALLYLLSSKPNGLS